MLSSELKFELHQGSDRQLHYTMECGKHKATVSFSRGLKFLERGSSQKPLYKRSFLRVKGTCRNKKYGRELASQSILQVSLFPEWHCWRTS